MKRNQTTPSELSGRIRRQAIAMGFSKVGIAPAEALTEESVKLREWLARGYHGEMKWMERDPEQRVDPRRIFPAARSVIVVTLNYYTPHQHDASSVSTASSSERIGVSTGSGPGSPRGQPAWDGGCDRIDPYSENTRVRPAPQSASRTGKVSRYAWGDDYHDVVADKLRELLLWIKEQWPEADGKVCVDIQPTMDKAWAIRAGLGWMGKHANVITEEYGSWVFIGELLLNLELKCDEIGAADQCGSCTLCLEACPTGAITEPYVVNSNLCISHATIESRAPEIRAEVATHLEGWLYGCDICQDVCPWNQMTPETNEPRFEPREGNVNASLSQIVELTPETYAARFRRSAMKRAKLAGLQRNAKALQYRSQ